MSILISRTFEIVTYQSAQHGDAEERGFLAENEEVTFRELVDLMRGHPEASSSGPVTSRGWFSSYPQQNMQTGAEETTAIHFSRDNSPRLAKYWSKAAAFAQA